MRWRRSCKRLMILLMFVCMTVKLHLEFRLLDATKSDNSFSPWWSNETLGHLRGFPKTKFFSRGHGMSRASSKNFVFIGNESVKILEFGKKVFPDASLLLGGGNKALNPKDVMSPLFNVSHKNVSVLFQESTKNNETHHNSEAVRNNTEKAVSPKPIVHKPNESGNRNEHPGVNQAYNNRKLTNDEGTEAKSSGTKSPTTVNSGTQTEKVPKEKLEDGQILQPQVAKPKKVIRIQPKVVPLQVPKPSPKPPPKPAIKPAIRPGIKRGNVVKRGVSHDVDSREVSLTPDEIEEIKRNLEHFNEEQTIHNEHVYGPVLRNTTILLVQVHNRLENLRYLVESMKNTKDINESLVIFSHDYWYPAMNDFVSSIKEFRVLQMFFPLSIQLHPHKFPGRDPRDCSWNVNRLSGLECLNRDWPDSYGHYREASFTQIKHHWWWKIHRVFNELRVTKTNYVGHVVFLEEDHYILPDLLYVLSVLQRERISHCPSCQVLALGNYNKMSPNVYKNFVERGDWWVTKHNLGFALDIGAWKALSTCRSQFCQFDDYNWDWTLNNLIQTCFKPRMSMLSVKFSRVIHVGSCGTHVKKRSCDVTKEVHTAKNRIGSGNQWLFPKSLAYQNVYRGSGRVKKGNGGWGDYRDRQLCQAIWNGTASEGTLRTLDMN